MIKIQLPDISFPSLAEKCSLEADCFLFKFYRYFNDGMRS